MDEEQVRVSINEQILKELVAVVGEHKYNEVGKLLVATLQDVRPIVKEEKK